MTTGRVRLMVGQLVLAVLGEKVDGVGLAQAGGVEVAA